MGVLHGAAGSDAGVETGASDPTTGPLGGGLVDRSMPGRLGVVLGPVLRNQPPSCAAHSGRGPVTAAHQRTDTT